MRRMSPKSQHRGLRRFRPLLEGLEDRCVPAVTGALTGYDVVFTGDSASDTSILSVDGNGFLAINGSTDLNGDSITNDLLVSHVTSLTYNDTGNNDTLVFGGGNPFNFSSAPTISIGTTDTIATLEIDQQVNLAGSGSFTAQVARNIALFGNSTLTTAEGDITLKANTDGSTNGDFIGILINSATVQSGTGEIMLEGHGGIGTETGQHGVELRNGSEVASVGGHVTVKGHGGSGTGFSDGVRIGRLGSGKVTSGVGVFIEGFGGESSTDNGQNSGVFIFGNGGQVSSNGDVDIVGMAGNGGDSNIGVRISQSAQVTAGGNVIVTGVGGVGTGNGNSGISIGGQSGTTFPGSKVEAGGTVELLGTGVSTRLQSFGVTFGNGGTITAGSDISIAGSTQAGNTDGIRIVNSGTVSSTGGTISLDGEAPGGSPRGVRVAGESRVETDGRDIDVNSNNSIAISGIDAGSGTVTLSANNVIHETPSTSGRQITAGEVIINGRLSPNSNPSLTEEFIVDGNVTFDSGAIFVANLGDVVGGEEPDQLRILGADRVVDLGGATLNAVRRFTPLLGHQFVIVDNVDPTSSIINTFANLMEGDTITSGPVEYTISYSGGADGNDVVLTVTQVPNSPPATPVDVDSDDNIVPEGSAAGTPVGITADASDPDGDLVTYSLTDDAGGRFQIHAETGIVTVANSNLLDDAVHSITVQASDPLGAVSSANFVITVTNVAPVITSLTTNSPITGPAMPGETVTLTLTFDDPGVLDVHTVVIDWDDGSKGQVIVLRDGQRTLTVDHVFIDNSTDLNSISGFFDVSVTLEDDDGGADTGETAAAVTGTRLTDDGQLQVVGSSENDSIQVNKLGQSSLAVNWSFLPKGKQTFDLTAVNLIVIHGSGGDDHIKVSGNVDTRAILFGGAGNDRLEAGGGPAVLDGGDGDDILLGGSGNDILIGGLGADVLKGGAGDDILIAGFVDANLSDLVDALDEWNSENDYETRNNNLESFFAQIQGDDSEDTLHGESGRDRFFADLDEDTLKDWNEKEEFLDDIG